MRLWATAGAMANRQTQCSYCQADATELRAVCDVEVVWAPALLLFVEKRPGRSRAGASRRKSASFGTLPGWSPCLLRESGRRSTLWAPARLVGRRAAVWQHSRAVARCLAGRVREERAVEQGDEADER